MKKYDTNINKNIEDLFEKAKNAEPVLSQEDARSLVESGLKYSNHSNVKFKGKTAMALLTTSIAAAAWWGMSLFIAPTANEQIANELSRETKHEQTFAQNTIANDKQNIDNTIAKSTARTNEVEKDVAHVSVTVATDDESNANENTDLNKTTTVTIKRSNESNIKNIHPTCNSINSDSPIQVKGVNILNLSITDAEKIGITFEGDRINLVGLEKSPTPALITLQKNNVTTDIGSPLVKSLPKLSPRFITDASGNRLISMFTSDKVNTLISNTNADSGYVKIKEKRIFHQLTVDTNNIADKNKLKDVHIITKTRTTATVMRDGQPVTCNTNTNNSDVDLTIKIDQMDGNKDNINYSIQDSEDNNTFSDEDLILIAKNNQNTSEMVNKYLYEMYDDSAKYCKTRLDSNQLFERLVQEMAKKIVLPCYDTASHKDRVAFHIEMKDALGKESSTEHVPLNIDDLKKMKFAMMSKDSNFNVIVMQSDINLEFEINKLVPVGVGFEPNKTDYIIWYEPSKELAENLPAEYSNPLLVEFNALNKSGEFCGSQPVAGEPVFDTWRACSGAIENMSAFPNPASDYINLKFNLSGERTLNIAINDLYGKEQVRLSNSEKLSAGEHTKQYSFKALPAGMYLVVVQTEQGETAVQRIIVE